MDKQKITRAALINILSRGGVGILRVIQLMLIARVFGASLTTDAYIVARWIPLFVWGLGDTVFTVSLVPYLVSLKVKNGIQSARETTDHIFSWFLLLLLGVALAIYFTSPFVVYILAKGFSKETHDLTVKLLRWLCLAIFFGGLTAFSASLLYTIRKFIVPAIAAMFPSLGVIWFIILGNKYWGINSAVIGFIVGVTFQLIALHIALFRQGIHPRFRWTGFSEFVKAGKVIGPRFGGVGLNRAIIAVDRFFASMLGAGAVSVLAYSFKLAQMPFYLIIAAFNKTLMPVLSKKITEGGIDNIKAYIPRGIGLVLFGLAPLVFIMIYYRISIISILFESSSFTSENTYLTAKVFVYSCLAILSRSFGVIFSGILYASGDTWTPFKITSLSLVLNAILDFVLMRFWGVTGIAIATLGVTIIRIIILYQYLKARIGRIEISQVFISIVKIAVATGFMGATIWGMTKVLDSYITFQNLNLHIIQICVFSIFSWLVFLVVCRVLKLEEYKTLKMLIRWKI